MPVDGEWESPRLVFLFGKDRDKGIRQVGNRLEIVKTADVPARDFAFRTDYRVERGGSVLRNICCCWPGSSPPW